MKDGQWRTSWRMVLGDPPSAYEWWYFLPEPTLWICPPSFLPRLLFSSLPLNTSCSQGSILDHPCSHSMFFPWLILPLPWLKVTTICCWQVLPFRPLFRDVVLSTLSPRWLKGSDTQLTWSGPHHFSLVTPNLWLLCSSLIFRYYPFLSYSLLLPFQAISQGFS